MDFNKLNVLNRLPEWVTKRVYNDLEQIAIFWYQSYTGTPALARLMGGFLLGDLLEVFTNKTQSTLSPDRTFYMYSAHDTTIVNILNTLGLFDVIMIIVFAFEKITFSRFQGKLPPFASCVMFELHRINREYFIQIFYKKKPSKPAMPLFIPNCGVNCPLEKFRRIYQSLIPTGDYDTECALKY